jgi:hypothetical protein
VSADAEFTFVTRLDQVGRPCVLVPVSLLTWKVLLVGVLDARDHGGVLLSFATEVPEITHLTYPSGTGMEPEVCEVHIRYILAVNVLVRVASSTPRSLPGESFVVVVVASTGSGFSML